MRMLLATAICLLAAAPLAADERIPFPARINGQPVQLGFDTGASHSFLFPHAIKRLNLKVTEPPADFKPKPLRIAAGLTEACDFEFDQFKGKARFRTVDIPDYLPRDVDGVVAWRDFKDASMSKPLSRGERG